MPSLILFGRRWRIGSDDFVFPGCFEATVRIAWMILTFVLFFEHITDSNKVDSGGSSCEKGEMLIRIYLIGVMVILCTSFILSVLLATHSAKGTIMVTGPRKYVSKILLLRVVLGVFEIGWNILGTLWLYSDQVQCEANSPLWILLEALVIFTWVALPILVMAALILFEPMMRPERESTRPRPSSILDRTNSGLGSHYIQLWERRCRILCCTFSRDENSAEAFRNVADVLASVFEDSDLVASDIAAALVLLRLRKKYEELQQERSNNCNDNRNIRPNQEPAHPFKNPPPNWMTLSNAYHFMKFAMGSYGWPWYFYGNMLTACLSLKKFIKCCGCCRPSIIDDSKDNCCRCNLAALRAITNLPEENIIYLSFHNKIYETPFFVAIDDETKNVVVSIRGTLSLYDTITDLNAQSTLLGYEGLPSGCRAHKGMVNVAQFVKRKLDETQAISQALGRRTGYGLIITGHSLGAGAAVLLSAMLRPDFPHLRCFAFSPPGGLCSLEMYTATQDFVMSVIVGDDLVPRLSIAAIHDLHNKILNVLQACKKPKYRVLAKGCWYLLFGISKSSLHSSCVGNSSSPDDQLISPVNSGSYSYESIQDIRIMFSEEPWPLPRHTETPLFPPGRIVYLTPKYGTVTKESAWNVRWGSNAEFQSILITPCMLRHHLPQVVLSVLEKSVQSRDATVLNV